MKYLVAALSTIGMIAASTMSVACMMLWLDEPEMPESLIK